MLCTMVRICARAEPFPVWARPAWRWGWWVVLAACGPGRSQQAPTITGIIPARVDSEWTGTVTVRGEHLYRKLRIDLDSGRPPRIEGQFTVRLRGSASQEGYLAAWERPDTLRFVLHDPLRPRTYDVLLTTPDGRTVTRPAGFTVVASDRDGGQGGEARTLVEAHAGRAGAEQRGEAGGSLPMGGAQGGSSGAGGAWDRTGGSGPHGGAFSSGGEGGGQALPPPRCVATSTAGPGVISLYRFEGDMGDYYGERHGQALGGSPSYGSGPSGCGNALVTGPTSYAYIPYYPEWELYLGSVELWVRADTVPAAEPVGIISRNAAGAESFGHLTLYQAGRGSGRLVAQVETGGDSAYLCSEAPLEPGVWTHVGLNFGAPELELLVNGEKQSYAGSVPLYDAAVPCGRVVDWGIGGNENPWIVGAASDAANEGEASPLRGFFPGAIDEFQIRSSRLPGG